jgi:MFS family permease
MAASALAWSFLALLITRVALGVLTAAAGPGVASLLGDSFSATPRAKVYGWVLAGELVGTGFGFVVSGDLATVSWRLAFAILAIPAIGVAWLWHRMAEPERRTDCPRFAVDRRALHIADHDEPDTDHRRGRRILLLRRRPHLHGELCS